jgi:hypothetical protein
MSYVLGFVVIDRRQRAAVPKPVDEGVEDAKLRERGGLEGAA